MEQENILNAPSLKEFDDTLQENGIINVDWNALDGDAEGKPYSTEEMLNYVKKTSKGKNHVVILMHDAAGKEKTVEILPQIIDYYKNEGYDFKVIKNTSKEENNSNQSENNKDNIDHQMVFKIIGLYIFVYL